MGCVGCSGVAGQDAGARARCAGARILLASALTQGSRAWPGLASANAPRPKRKGESFQELSRTAGQARRRHRIPNRPRREAAKSWHRAGCLPVRPRRATLQQPNPGTRSRATQQREAKWAGHPNRTNQAQANDAAVTGSPQQATQAPAGGATLRRKRSNKAGIQASEMHRRGPTQRARNRERRGEGRSPCSAQQATLP